jgi:hypothetical protein
VRTGWRAGGERLGALAILRKSPSSSTSKGLRCGSNKAIPVLAMLLARPFGGTLEMATRKPWQSLEKHLALIQFTNLHLGGAYIAAGEKARFSGC